MSKSGLKTLAGLTWFVMGGWLLYRGATKVYGDWHKNVGEYKGDISDGVPNPIFEDFTSHTQIIIYLIIALIVGAAKGKFVLSKSAKRNIERIDRLEAPKPWNIFSLKFLPLIALMIGFGRGMMYLAWRNDADWNQWITFAGAGANYVGVGAGLMMASLVFFKKKIDLAS